MFYYAYLYVRINSLITDTDIPHPILVKRIESMSTKMHVHHCIKWKHHYYIIDTH